MPSRFWFLIEIGAVVRALKPKQQGGRMFALVSKIYTVLLRGLFVAVLLSGGRLMGIDDLIKSSRNCVRHGLVEIPRIFNK